MDQQPRINAALLPKFLGRTVILAGAITGNYGDSVTISASDGGVVNVQLPAGEQVYGRYAQITGKVTGSNSIDAIFVNCTEGEFDLATYDKAVQLMHGKYNEIFL